MAGNNMHNLTTLIKRLEAATSRLEDIASSSTAALPGVGESGINGTVAGQTASGEGSAQAKTPDSSTTGSVSKGSGGGGPIVEDYDTLINGELDEFCKLSEALDPLISKQAQALLNAFKAQKAYLLMTTRTKKPDQTSPEFMDLVKDTREKMLVVDDMRGHNRGSPFSDHLALVAEGVGTLSWIAMEHKPSDYVSELFGGAQIYGNKILKKYKEKDASQINWVNSFYKVMKGLVAYVKEHHPRGIQWNPNGVSAEEALREVSQPASSSGGPPPPPPGPPPVLTATSPTPPPPPPPPPGGAPPPGRKTAPAPDMGAVFDQLNKGEEITSGLKKVDPSMQTHKNPSLRSSSTVPSGPTRSDSQSSIGRSRSPVPPGKRPPKPESMRAKKPSRKELDGNKWIIENFDTPSSPIEIPAAIHHSILITRCKATTIRITGKANAVSIDSSSQTSLLIDSLVSSVDVIKCPGFALQVLDTLPTVMLDQVDGATIYLGASSLNTEIFTSKCSNVNVYLPPPEGVDERDADYKECNVPEQFRSVVKNGKLVTEIVEHMG